VTYHCCNIYVKLPGNFINHAHCILFPAIQPIFFYAVTGATGLHLIWLKSTNTSELRDLKQSFKFCSVILCLESLNTYSRFEV